MDHDEMDFDAVIRELKALYGDEERLGHPPRIPVPRESEIKRWSFTCGSRAAFYDQVALYLARGFQSSDLSFEFCDAVANGLFATTSNAEEGCPEFFQAVYLAFDEGEYYHNNNRDEDPVETYTRPMIARILEGNPVS
jgi:hypothetical protein